MSTALLEKPEPATTQTARRRMDHMYCCDHDTTLCGLPSPNPDVPFCPDGCGHDVCEWCQWSAETPCDTAACPKREASR